MTVASRKRPADVPRDAELQWSQALTGFFAHLVEQERSTKTQKSYRDDLLQFGRWYRDAHDELPIPALIQPSEIREWKTHMSATCKHEPATVNRRLASVRSFLKWAEGEGITPAIQTPRSIRQVQPPPRWLEVNEKRALIRALGRFRGVRDAAMTALLLHTGIRVQRAGPSRMARRDGEGPIRPARRTRREGPEEAHHPPQRRRQGGAARAPDHRRRPAPPDGPGRLGPARRADHPRRASRHREGGTDGEARRRDAARPPAHVRTTSPRPGLRSR